MELVLLHLHFRCQDMCREVELGLTDASNAMLVGQSKAQNVRTRPVSSNSKQVNAFTKLVSILWQWR